MDPPDYTCSRLGAALLHAMTQADLMDLIQGVTLFMGIIAIYHLSRY